MVFDIDVIECKTEGIFPSRLRNASKLDMPLFARISTQHVQQYAIPISLHRKILRKTASRHIAHLGAQSGSIPTQSRFTSTMTVPKHWKNTKYPIRVESTRVHHSIIKILIAEITHKTLRPIIPTLEVTPRKPEDSFRRSRPRFDRENVLFGDVADGFIADPGIFVSFVVKFGTSFRK